MKHLRCREWKEPSVSVTDGRSHLGKVHQSSRTRHVPSGFPPTPAPSWWVAESAKESHGFPQRRLPSPLGLSSLPEFFSLQQPFPWPLFHFHPKGLTTIQFWHYPELIPMSLRAKSSTRLPLLQMPITRSRSPQATHTSDWLGYKFEGSHDHLPRFWQFARTLLRTQGSNVLATGLVIMDIHRARSGRVLGAELPCPLPAHQCAHEPGSSTKPGYPEILLGLSLIFNV